MELNKIININCNISIILLEEFQNEMIESGDLYEMFLEFKRKKLNNNHYSFN